MDWIVAFFSEAGLWGTILAALGLPTILLALSAAFAAFALRTEPRFPLTASAFVGGCVVLILLVGTVGTFIGHLQMAEMLSYLDGEEAARVEEYGPRLAMAPLRIAATLCGTAILFALPAWIRGSKSYKDALIRPDGFNVGTGWAATAVDEL